MKQSLHSDNLSHYWHKIHCIFHMIPQRICCEINNQPHWTAFGISFIRIFTFPSLNYKHSVHSLRPSNKLPKADDKCSTREDRGNGHFCLSGRWRVKGERTQEQHVKTTRDYKRNRQILPLREKSSTIISQLPNSQRSASLSS